MLVWLAGFNVVLFVCLFVQHFPFLFAMITFCEWGFFFVFLARSISRQHITSMNTAWDRRLMHAVRRKWRLEENVDVGMAQDKTDEQNKQTNIQTNKQTNKASCSLLERRHLRPKVAHCFHPWIIFGILCTSIAEIFVTMAINGMRWSLTWRSLIHSMLTATHVHACCAR